MDDVTFQRRLRAILGDPILSLTVLDPRAEEPYLQLCDLFMECTEKQRAHIRAGWPYGRQWRIPVPGTIHDWRGGEISERRLRAWAIHEAIEPAMPDFRDVVIGFPVMYWAANQIGMNAEELFEEVAMAAIPEVRQLMMRSLNRTTKRQRKWAGLWSRLRMALATSRFGDGGRGKKKKPRGISPRGFRKP